MLLESYNAVYVQPDYRGIHYFYITPSPLFEALIFPKSQPNHRIFFWVTWPEQYSKKFSAAGGRGCSADPLLMRKFVYTPVTYFYTPARYIHTPTRYVHTPARYVYTPATYVHTPARYVYTPARYIHTPARYVYTPARYVHTPTRYVYTPCQICLHPCQICSHPCQICLHPLPDMFKLEVLQIWCILRIHFPKEIN